MNGVLLALAVAVLGGIGAVARFLIHSFVVRINASDFPLGTFSINVVGSLALGTLVGASAGHDVRLLIGTAMLGAFTTFSTWMFESERLYADGSLRSAVANLVTSSAIGLGAVALGVLIGGAL